MGLLNLCNLWLHGTGTAETGDHPAFVRVKEVSVSRSDMRLRRGKRTAAQNFLIDEPLVVVFVKLRLESGIRHVIGDSPLPHVANHLLATVRVLAVRKRSHRRYRPKTVFEEICVAAIGIVVAPGKSLLNFALGIITRRFLPFSFGGEA